MNKNESAEIKTLVLNLGGKKISLTIDQAKKLAAALHEMFGPKQAVQYVYPSYWYKQPWVWPITYTTPVTKPSRGDIWCDGTNSTASIGDCQITYMASNQSLCCVVD